MMKPFFVLLLSFFCGCCAAQDTLPTNKALAATQINQLHDGTLVVRLKTYSKSVAAYRASGKNKLADKLERNYRIINLFLMKAFLENFFFCKVLFIKAEDSRKLVGHQPYIYLNEKLQTDSTISPPAGPVFIAEFGELMSNDRTSDKSFVVKHTEETSSGGSTSAIFISDTTFTQLKEPFPFYALVSVVDEALPALAPGANGAPVDTSAWRMEGTSPKGKVNAIWKKDIYNRPVKHLNKELIKYYIKVNKGSGKYISDDVMEWEHKNPNQNVDTRLKLLTDQITSMQEVQEIKIK
jgi:hypothetical protein